MRTQVYIMATWTLLGLSNALVKFNRGSLKIKVLIQIA